MFGLHQGSAKTSEFWCKPVLQRLKKALQAPSHEIENLKFGSIPYPVWTHS